MSVILNSPVFEKFIIHKDYSITTLDENGREIEIKDEERKKQILDSDYLSGSIGITRDTKKKGWLHPLLNKGQRLNSFFQGRNADPAMAHGMIILKNAVKKEGEDKIHPFVFAHSVFQGIQTAKRDYLQEDEVTELIIYRPKDAHIRELFCKNAYKTAYVNKRELATPESPQQKSPFSIWDLLSSIFRNKKHEACAKYGTQPSKRMMKRTALLMADLLLGNQILNRKGNPRALFCMPYAVGILQGSLIMKALDEVGEEAKNKFINDKKGVPLARDQLSKKILESIAVTNKEDLEQDDTFAQALWETYWGDNKMPRIDYRYVMSAYVAKNLDKLCMPNTPLLELGKTHFIKYEPKEMGRIEKVVRWYKTLSTCLLL